MSAGLVVARYLGPERFGLLSYAISFVALFSFLTTLGQETIMIRDLVNKPQDRDVLLVTSFGMRAMGSVVLLVVVAAISCCWVPSEAKPLVLIVATAAVFHPLLVLTTYLFSQVKAGGIALAELVSVVGSSVFKVVLVLAGASLLWFASAKVIEAALSGLILFAIFRKVGGALPAWSFSWPLAGRLLKESSPLILSGLMSMVYMRIDQVMLMSMSGEEALGLYAAAVRLSEAVYFIPAVIVSSLSPAAIDAYKVSIKKFESYMERLFRLLLVSALIIAVPISLLADTLIAIALGTSYHGAGVVLSILSYANVFFFFSLAVNQWLIIENNQIWSVYRTASGVVINILLNYYLIPIYGPSGAAISTFVSYAFASYISLLPVHSLRRVFIVQTKALFFWLPLNRVTPS